MITLCGTALLTSKMTKEIVNVIDVEKVDTSAETVNNSLAKHATTVEGRDTLREIVIKGKQVKASVITAEKWGIWLEIVRMIEILSATIVMRRGTLPEIAPLEGK